MKFKTPYNATEDRGEVNTQPSMTIPDQTLSIQQLLRRQAQGLTLDDFKKVGNYEEELLDGMSQEEFKRLDLADQESYIRERQIEAEELKQKARVRIKKAAELQQIADAKAVEEARDRHRAARDKQNPPADQAGGSTNNP